METTLATPHRMSPATRMEAKYTPILMAPVAVQSRLDVTVDTHPDILMLPADIKLFFRVIVFVISGCSSVQSSTDACADASTFKPIFSATS